MKHTIRRTTIFPHNFRLRFSFCTTCECHFMSNACGDVLRWFNDDYCWSRWGEQVICVIPKYSKMNSKHFSSNWNCRSFQSLLFFLNNMSQDIKTNAQHSPAAYFYSKIINCNNNSQLISRYFIFTSNMFKLVLMAWEKLETEASWHKLILPSALTQIVSISLPATL